MIIISLIGIIARGIFKMDIDFEMIELENKY